MRSLWTRIWWASHFDLVWGTSWQSRTICINQRFWLVGTPTGPYPFKPAAHWLMLWLQQLGVVSNHTNNNWPKFAVQIISQILNIKNPQIFWYWGDPHNLRVMGCYSDSRLDHYSELHKFFKLCLSLLMLRASFFLFVFVFTMK